MGYSAGEHEAGGKEASSGDDPQKEKKKYGGRKQIDGLRKGNQIGNCIRKPDTEPKHMADGKVMHYWVFVITKSIASHHAL